MKDPPPETARPKLVSDRMHCHVKGRKPGLERIARERRRLAAALALPLLREP
jgi:hypothetical protein